VDISLLWELSVVSSAMGRSLVQRSSTNCGVLLCVLNNEAVLVHVGLLCQKKTTLRNFCVMFFNQYSAVPVEDANLSYVILTWYTRYDFRLGVFEHNT
jgi:hypothetical protein